MKLSVVIPCYNERSTIEAVVEEVRSAPVEDVEIIVVDDGSADGTRELLQGKPPGWVDKLVLQERADVVFGSRFMGGRPHRVVYFWHMVGNRFLTLLSNMFTNLNLTDMETGYKVFRRELLHDITIEEKRFGVEPEIIAKVAKAGLRVFEVGISYSGRTYEQGKKIGWRDGVRAVYVIVKYNLFRRNKGLWKGNTQESTSSKRWKARTTTTIT